MSKFHRFLDIAVFVVSLALVGATAYWILQNNVLSVSLLQSDNPTWYLIRSAGMAAYALLTVSMVWGLFLSSRVIKDWSPGPVSLLLHSTLSWLALVFGLGHALILMLDHYFRYRLSDIFVPFTGPYRPLAVGLGTLAFWFSLVITLSFPLKRFISHRVWHILHFSSYITFVMATAHGLMAGTDIDQPGFRWIIAGSALFILTLSAYRLLKAAAPTPHAARSARAAIHSS
jgi:methionine sulfoxide reductase heme-binding subunit